MGATVSFNRYKPLTLTSAELARNQRAPEGPNNDCSRVRVIYQRLTGSHHALGKKGLHNAGFLTDDEVAIYKTILLQWVGHDKTPLAVALQTYPLRVFFGPLDTSCECLKDIGAETLAAVSRSFHRLTPVVLPRRNMNLVDTSEGEQQVANNDPETTMAISLTVHDAVTNGINKGLFSLSQIAFDHERQRALVSYTFHCGMLCGSGMTLVFEKVKGQWRRAKVECGGWVS